MDVLRWTTRRSAQAPRAIRRRARRRWALAAFALCLLLFPPPLDAAPPLGPDVRRPAPSFPWPPPGVYDGVFLATGAAMPTDAQGPLLLSPLGPNSPRPVPFEGRRQDAAPRGPARWPQLAQAPTPSNSLPTPAATALARALQDRLASTRHIQAVSPITVTIDGTTAILRGAVESGGQRRLAERLVLLEPAVEGVRNELVVAPARGGSDPEWVAERRLPGGSVFTIPDTLQFVMTGAPPETTQEGPSLGGEPPPELELLPSPSDELALPAPLPASEAAPYRRDLALRFGWWSATLDGSPVRVGQYEDLASSPFWDLDQFTTDSVSTVNVFATGANEEGDRYGLFYFGPRFSADVDYQRYIHWLIHDPLTNTPAFPSNEEIIHEDLNVGQDYVIRVQQLNTYLKGPLTKNIQWRLNLHFLRKEGQRQAKAVQHCADTGAEPTCHVLSQSQYIDWKTATFEPVFDGQFGPVTIQYSRPMRVFNRSDQVVTRDYGDFLIYGFEGQKPYGVVPENLTQTDRLKIGADLGADTRFYGLLHNGDTLNRFRQTHRTFRGLDLRLTNRSWQGWLLTGYVYANKQTTDFPAFLIEPEAVAVTRPTSIVPPYGVRHPINYSKKSVGARASWRPRRWSNLSRGLLITADAEYGSLARDFADYTSVNPVAGVDQDKTPYWKASVGASMRWSPSLQTYVRYRRREYLDPLFGVDLDNGAVTNTSLPQREDVVEIGGSWVPSPCLLASVTSRIANARHHSEIADFTEDNYPYTATLWYAPWSALSLSAGYGSYSNWIDQDIYFPSDTPLVDPLDKRSWSYGGQGHVLSLGANYDWTERARLSGGLEFVHGRDTFDPLEPWPDLPGYSAVTVDRTRVTAGVDWRLFERGDAYFRYIYENYTDETAAYLTGTVHMLLGGLSAVY